MRKNVYLQVSHSLVIDGVPISNFAEGDWLQIHSEGNAAARTRGGDGPVMNLSVPQGGTINVNLMPTSPALGALLTIRDQQRNNPRLFSITLETGVSEIIAAAGCAFGELPQFATGGPTLQPRQFLFECLNIQLDLSDVEPIDGGML